MTPCGPDREASLAGPNHASSSRRAQAAPLALSSLEGEATPAALFTPRAPPTPASGCAVVGLPCNASRTLAAVEPASQHGGLPNLAKP